MVNSEEGVIRFEKHNFGQLEPKQHPKIQESVLENPTFWLLKQMPENGHHFFLAICRHNYTVIC